jgi:hypothetical protein
MSKFSTSPPPIGSSINYNNPITTGLLLCYPMNEQSGNTVYDLVGGKNLTLANGPLYANQFGGGLFFDGSNDYAENSTLVTSLSGLSVSIWVYRTGNFDGNYRKIFVIGDAGNNVSVYLSQGPGPQIYFGIGTTSGQNGPSTNITLPGNIWHHLVGTWNGSVVRLYINGKLVSSLNYAGTWPGSYRTYPVRVGWGYGSEYYQGYLRNLLFFNRSLDAEEVLSLYEQPYEIYDKPVPRFFRANNTIGVPSIQSAESFQNHNLLGPITFYPSSIQAPVNNQQQVIKSFANNDNKINIYNNALEYNFDTEITAYKKLSIPTVTTDLFGTTGSETYYYRVSAYNQYGETDTELITVKEANTTLSSNNFVRLRWNYQTNCLGYKIYGRSINSQTLIATVNNVFYDDIGSTPGIISYQGQNTSGYKPNKLNLGPLIRKYSSDDPIETFVGPLTLECPGYATSFVGFWPYFVRVFNYDDTFIYYIMIRPLTQQTKTFILFRYDKINQNFLAAGYIDIITSSTSNSNPNDYFAEIYYHRNGTVQVSGTSVSGTNTFWVAEGVAVGARIGFGSTDHRYITTWYEISAITNDNTLTLSKSAGTINANTPYVIEELRIFIFDRHTASPNDLSGLSIAKGLHFGLFGHRPTTIPLATTIDNQRAAYKLKFPTVFPISSGLVVDESFTLTDHKAYVHHYHAQNERRIFVYNLRAPLLNLTNGITSSGCLFYTGVFRITRDSFRMDNVHIPTSGPYKGKKIAMASDYNYGYILDVEALKPLQKNVLIYRRVMHRPGGLYIAPSRNSAWSGTTYYKDYDMYFSWQNYDIAIGKHRTERDMGISAKIYNINLHGNLLQGSIWKYPWNLDGSYIWDTETANLNDSGILICQNHLYGRNNGEFAVALAADYVFAKQSFNRLITPTFLTPNVHQYKKLYVNHALILKSHDIGIRPEFFRVFARTQGIDNDNGEWIRIRLDGDMSHIQPDDQIQFMFEFRTFNKFSVPARLYGITLTYDSISNLPKELVLSLSDTNIAQNIYGFRQTKLFDNLNYLTIEIYNKTNDNILLSQNSLSSTHGYFQYFTSSWQNGIGPNLVGLRRRFVCTSALPQVDINIRIFKGR